MTDSKIPSPREFLQSRRPERFSDSVRVTKRQLDRLQLEYHLDTITNRGEETTFEHFARALAELEICPNLLPHTGPTGGGDSKADSETVPIADALSLSWYGGFAKEASSERWAFAFSAMKKWRSKVRSDVKKIAGTHRGYTKAIFVTNQYVPDRQRAQVEDELRGAHGIDVRILDRAWILDSVFRNQRQNLAIDTLGLPESLRDEIRLGPMDTEREAALTRLDAAVEQGLREGRRDRELVADAIESATTARALDRPRVEVDGRFLRAMQLAEKAATLYEKLDAAYEWAWTTFWWYEDFTKYSELVARAFEIAGDTDNPYHLELLTNLVTCLRSAIQHFGIVAATTRFAELADRLALSLRRVARTSERSSNALHAATLLIQVRLLSEPSESDALLRELRKILEKARYLVGYPFDTIAEFIREIGSGLGQSAVYEEIFETVVTISSERSGDIAAARLLLDRAIQRLIDGDHFGAIRVIGRCFGKLYKAETVPELVHALYLAGVAYREAGLLWVARGTILNAASIATDAFLRFGVTTDKQVACYERMMWLELELGRLTQALEWHELSVASRHFHAGPQAEESDLRLDPFDAVLGIHFLKTNLVTLRALERLPDVLDERGLFIGRSALLFALGQPHEIPDVVVAGEEGASEEAFFRVWRGQPASQNLRELALGTAATATIESNVLGCHVLVEHDNLPPGAELAESILAAFEGLAATGLTARWVAHEPLLKLTIRVSEFAEHPFSFRFADELGRPAFYLACRPFAPGSVSHEDQGLLKQRLLELAAEMFAHVVFVLDDHTLETLLGEDMAFQRAIDFAGSFVTTANVLGSSPKTRVDELFREHSHTYPLLRSEEWDASDRLAGIDLDRKPVLSTPAADQVTSTHVPTSHEQVRTVSLIRMSLWDRAGWNGMLFVTATGENDEVPSIYLAFSDGEAASKIFLGLIEDVGEEDTTDRLRIALIRGISTRNPAWYRVIVGNAQPTFTPLTSPESFAIMMARIHTMTPDSTVNLELFLSRYAVQQSYFLAPAILDDRKNVRALGRQHITKRHLHVRQAWEVGPNDADILGIKDDDDVLIPPGVEDPPLLRAQEWRRRT